jgi:tetratricopeptide (TPR) repeat protein
LSAPESVTPAKAILMAEPDLPGPTTSYSDPFYDRLEAAAQRIARRLWLVLLGIVVVVVVAVVTHTALRDTPIAASAGKFLDASTTRQSVDEARDPGERASRLAAAEKALAAVAADTTVTPYYRTRAGIELAQVLLDRDALSEAKTTIDQARTLAATAGDPDLDLAVGLSEAAILLQTGDAAGAESRYAAVERAAGATYPDRQIAAVLGGAQALLALGRRDDAIAKLEPLITRSDETAASLLNLARNQYWALKRQAATPAAAPAPAATDPATPAAAPADQPAPATTAPPAPAPAASAPSTPVTPTAPAPAPGPEGK